MDSGSVKSNLVCAWVGQRQLQLQQRTVKSLGDEDVSIKMMATGLCGSDGHIWEKPSLSRQVVLGHEAAGIIAAVGSGVKDRQVGQRVAVEPGIACLK
jgi:D-xylulose reductase